MFLFLKDIVKGMKRRRKEIRLLAIVQFLVIAFISSALLFQHNSERYNFENNKSYYGDWVLAELITQPDKKAQKLGEHPYFDACGKVMSGVKVVDGEDKEYPYLLGSMDECFIELGNIELREGAFPQSDNEIAIETTLLIEMGYNLELGQEIELKFTDVEGIVSSRSFTLVGIIKKSATLWSIGSEMPAVVVTENVINSLNVKHSIIYCYQLGEKYEDVDTAELFSNITETYGESYLLGYNLKYNDYLYTTSFWGTQQMYDFISKMILVMGVAAMSFLLAAYIQKRKKAYYNLRIIGMTTGRVRLLILFESLCFSLFSGLLAIVVTLILGAGVAYYLSVTKELDYFYEIPLSLVKQVLLVWGGIFAGSNIIAMVATGKKRLYANTQAISTRFLPRWSLNKLKHKHIYSSIFIRENRVFKLRSMFGGLVCVVFAALLMVCGSKIWEKYYSYRYVNDSYNDFVAEISADEPLESGEYVWDKYPEVTHHKPYSYGSIRLSAGYSEGFYEQLDTIGGIDSYTLSTYDAAHLFEWDNMESDPYITYLLTEEKGGGSFKDENGEFIEVINTMEEQLDGNSLYFGYKGWYVSDTKKIYDKYVSTYDSQLMDYEEFVKGNQVFLIMPELGSFLTEGSTLSIVAGDEKIDVEVGCIISTEEIGNDYAHYITPQSFFITPGMYILGSETLGRRIAEAEGSEYMYNRIELNLDVFANYDTTVKQCAQLFDREHINVMTYYEIKQHALSEWLAVLIMYCTFIILLLGFFIIIRNNIIQSGFTFKGNQIKRLRMLGMDKKQIKRMYMLQGLHESKWIWLGIPVLYAIRANELYKEYAGTTYSMYVDKLGTWVSDTWELVKYNLPERINIWMCLAIIGIIVLINVATRYFVVRNYLKEMDKEVL